MCQNVACVHTESRTFDDLAAWEMDIKVLLTILEKVVGITQEYIGLNLSLLL